MFNLQRLVRYRIPLVVAGAFFVWLGYLSVAVTATSHPLFCGLCHEMSAEVRAYSTSPHAEVNCYSCHGASGLSAVVSSKVQLMTYIYRHVTQLYVEPVNKRGGLAETIPSSTCLECHTPKRVVTPSKGIKINHVVHTKRGMACTQCHNRVSHPGLSGRVDLLKMDACFRCHGVQPGAKAAGRCDKCHPSTFDLKPKDHRTKMWRLKNHGARARKDRRPCAMCHFRTFCDRCHQLPMPHPRDWAGPPRNQHAKVGVRAPLLCMHCHTQRDFCSTCHHKGYEAKKGPWVRQHFKIVRAQGIYNCIRCHSLSFCATCHVRGLSQPGQI